MEVLIFFALVIIIVLLISLRSGQNELADKTYKSFQLIKKELLEIKEAGLSTVKKETTIQPTAEDVVQWRPYTAPQVPAIPEKSKAQEPIIERQLTNEAEAIPAPTKVSEVEKMEAPVIKPILPVVSKESWWGKWLRNNPDLEKFVGENLVNKIGIAVLVLGIAFFVKYAIDQNWIKETGRVCIGIGCGAILVGIAHYLRNSYRSFSSVMAGGGIAVFYFTIAFAFHEYHMFSQTIAFTIMSVITAFAVALSLLYNKIELAVIAVAGGFMAPFLVSSGSGNYVALFTYLLILNIGMLTIAYFKKWPLLHVLSFFFTLLIFGSWLITIYAFGNTALPYKNALAFATAFYLVFLTTVLIHNLRTQKPFKAFDFSLVLLITFSYYAEGMIILSEWNTGAYQGIFTSALGVMNLCLAWYLFKTQKGDKNLLYLLIGLTLTFISLAAPVQMHGHTITLFWSAECVLLYWLHQRSRIPIFKYSSAIVLLLMLVSLLMDWSIANEKNNAYLPVIFTNWQGAITNIVAIASLGLYAVLLRKETGGNKYVFGLKNNAAGNGMAVAAAAVLYATCIFAVNLACISMQSFDIPNAYHQLITYLFLALILLVVSHFKIVQKPTLPIVLILSGFLFYLSGNSLANKLLEGVAENKYAGVHAIAHWLSAAALLYLLSRFIKIFQANTDVLGNGFAWLISSILLIIFSIECKHLYVAALAKPASVEMHTTQYLKAGLTIVWALFSFTIMWLGMKYKYKTLRIISLGIFSLALLKLFLFDIRNISEGGKIAAFIMLGILLLVISFMYQRLKKIIIDNEEKNR